MIDGMWLLNVLLLGCPDVKYITKQHAIGNRQEEHKLKQPNFQVVVVDLARSNSSLSFLQSVHQNQCQNVAYLLQEICHTPL